MLLPRINMWHFLWPLSSHFDVEISRYIILTSQWEENAYTCREWRKMSYLKHLLMILPMFNFELLDNDYCVSYNVKYVMLFLICVIRIDCCWWDSCGVWFGVPFFGYIKHEIWFLVSCILVWFLYIKIYIFHQSDYSFNI